MRVLAPGDKDQDMVGSSSGRRTGLITAQLVTFELRLWPIQPPPSSGSGLQVLSTALGSDGEAREASIPPN